MVWILFLRLFKIFNPSEASPILPETYRKSPLVHFPRSLYLWFFNSPITTTSIIKEFDLAYNENIIRWDGRNDFNKLISTGIYYITSYKDNKSISKKIAIIRK